MKSELRRLLGYSIRYWPRLLVSIMLMAFAGAAHGLIAALIRPIFDHVLQPQQNMTVIKLFSIPYTSHVLSS